MATTYKDAGVYLGGIDYGSDKNENILPVIGTRTATMTVEVSHNHHWFSPRYEFEAVVTEAEETADGITAGWEAIPGTHKDLTDYRPRARLMRWLYKNSTIFYWAYNKHSGAGVITWQQRQG